MVRFGRGGRRTIREVLEAKKVPEAEIADAEREGTLPLLAIEHLVFDERPQFAAGDVADHVGLPEDEVSHFWRALGFPDPLEGEEAFTKVDLEMMHIAANTISELLKNAVAMTRSLARGLHPVAAEPGALMVALRDLELGANTVVGCYDRNPGNFAAALADLKRYATQARAAIAAVGELK